MPSRAAAEWVLAPTERHVETLSDAGIPALTTRRLVRDLSRRREPDRAPTTPEMTRLLVASTLDVPIGHAQAIDDGVGRLRRAGTRPGSLRATRVERGARLAALLEALDAKLAARALRDDRKSAWAAAEELARDGELELPEGRAIVRGLVRWDAATLGLLEALHARLRRRGGDGVQIELPAFEGGPLKDSTDALASELERRWATANDAPGLGFVPTRAVSRDAASVIEAYDAASEARAAARAVLDGLDRGLPLDGIAVVAIDLSEAFLEPLRFELARARIPFVEPRGRPAIASPRAHAAIELLRLARGPLGRDALLDVLRVPELALAAFLGDDRAAIGELLHEIGSLPLRFDRTGTDLLDELGDRLEDIASDDPALSARLAPARAGLARFLDALRGLAEPTTRRAHTARIGAFFDALGLLETNSRTLEQALRRAAAGRRELLLGLGQDALGASAVAAAMERNVAAASAVGLGDDALGLGDFLEELELALEGVAPTRGAARALAVRVARPADVAGLDLDLVVLCGATDRNLDRVPFTDAGLGAEVEQRLPPLERPTPAHVEQRFTDLAVASALCRARRVVLTFATHDAAQAVGPSRLVRALLAENAESYREPPSPLAANARLAHRPGAPSAGARARIAIERRRVAFFADPNTPPDAFTGAAGDLTAFVGGDAERPVSVTALERSLRCGFLGFSGLVLRATRSDAGEEAIGAKERGNLLHAALAAGLEATRGAWGVAPRAELERRAREAARELLERRGRSALRRAGLACTVNDVECLLAFLFSREDAFRFEAAERGFGRGGEWPPLVLEPWAVSGRVDRIDATSDGRRVRVVDYKTRLPGKGDQERALQPYLYARKAALELGASEVEFAYVALEARSPRELEVYAGPADGEAVLEGVERANAAVRALVAGAVAPRPADTSHCARCDARDICRRPLSAPEGAEPT